VIDLPKIELQKSQELNYLKLIELNGANSNMNNFNSVLENESSKIISLESKLKKQQKENLDLKNEVNSLKMEIETCKLQNGNLMKLVDNLKNELIVKNKQLQKMNEGIFVPKNYQNVVELEEAEKILKNLEIEPNTFANCKIQLSILRTKFADYSLAWNTEMLEVKGLLAKIIPREELSDEQITENYSKMINLHNKLRKLNKVEIILKRKEDELKEKLQGFKQLLGI
jgi:hypothetical protein